MSSAPNDCELDTPELTSRLVGVEEGTVIVVGANIGATHTDLTWKGFMDPTKRNIRKVLIEPIPTLFSQLKMNVRLSGIQNAVLINAAVTNVTSTIKMYCIRPLSTKKSGRRFPRFITELCSQDRNRFFSSYGILTKQFSPELIAAHIYSVDVPGMTLLDLMQKYRISTHEVKSLQIDVEGLDDQVHFSPSCLCVYLIRYS